MSEILYNLLSNVLSALDGGYVFLITLGLQLALFTAVTLVSAFKPLYSIKNRAWFFISSLSALFFELVFLSLSVELELFYLSLALTLIFWCAVTLTPEKRIKADKGQLELARLMDDKARSVSARQASQENPPANPEPPACDLEDASRFELDFQHVRLVIQKLEYYPLSASDKKLVKELEENIYQAENQGFDSLLKNKINDGLGALLKIMSKYGV